MNPRYYIWRGLRKSRRGKGALTHAASGCRALRRSRFFRFLRAIARRSRTPGALLVPQRKNSLPAFLPARCIGRWEVFAEHPIVCIFQHMPFDTLGVCNMVV